MTENTAKLIAELRASNQHGDCVQCAKAHAVADALEAEAAKVADLDDQLGQQVIAWRDMRDKHDALAATLADAPHDPGCKCWFIDEDGEFMLGPPAWCDCYLLKLPADALAAVKAHAWDEGYDTWAEAPAGDQPPRDNPYRLETQ